MLCALLLSHHVCIDAGLELEQQDAANAARAIEPGRSLRMYNSRTGQGRSYPSAFEAYPAHLYTTALCPPHYPIPTPSPWHSEPPPHIKILTLPIGNWGKVGIAWGWEAGGDGKTETCIICDWVGEWGTLQSSTLTSVQIATARRFEQ